MLAGTSYSGTHTPLKQGSEIYFQGDTLYIIDLEGIKHPDTYLFQQTNDTVSFIMLDEFSIDCRDETPGLYRISWANNGEKLLFKPIHDACMARFTLLIAESPWFRKRDDGRLRNDWYFLDPEKDNISGISLYEAYKLLRFRKSQPVTVALIAGNVDQNHEDLKENLVNPESSISLSADKLSTQMAGIIAAKRSNGKGVEGIADNVKIMALDAWQENGENYEENVAGCIRYAVEKGAKVVVLTQLKPLSITKKPLSEAIAFAAKKGTLLFMSSESGTKFTSSNLPSNLLLVSSTEPQASMLFAPGVGVNLFTTTPSSTYGSGSGPEMACAVAAGLSALIWSYFPSLTAGQLKQVVFASGKKPSDLQGTKGTINAKRAYDLALKLSKKKK